MQKLVDAIKARKWKVVIGMIVAGILYYFGIPL